MGPCLEPKFPGHANLPRKLKAQPHRITNVNSHSRSRPPPRQGRSPTLWGCLSASLLTEQPAKSLRQCNGRAMSSAAWSWLVLLRVVTSSLTEKGKRVKETPLLRRRLPLLPPPPPLLLPLPLHTIIIIIIITITWPKPCVLCAVEVETAFDRLPPATPTTSLTPLSATFPP
ncbi:hypothetical protein VTJ83DRAFT_6296 [Remersonia thermophila]|uniref:Uncharacterized protein n=1 Tax=Remersonia thermophila TaxID=72144 RepID=A0ABR4D4B0_9PEZI